MLRKYYILISLSTIKTLQLQFDLKMIWNKLLNWKLKQKKTIPKYKNLIANKVFPVKHLRTCHIPLSSELWTLNTNHNLYGTKYRWKNIHTYLNRAKLAYSLTETFHTNGMHLVFVSLSIWKILVGMLISSDWDESVCKMIPNRRSVSLT